MNLVKLKDIKCTYKNQLHFNTQATNYVINKENNPTYSSIKEKIKLIIYIYIYNT